MEDSRTRYRVFSAIVVEISPQLRQVLSTLSGIGWPVRVVREDQLHVTLKFFGDVTRDQIATISRCQDTACANHSEFGWRLQGLGAFPSLKRISVVWAGAANGERLQSLAESLSTECEKAGFDSENRPFHPHLTLARVKFRPPAEVVELIQAKANVDYGAQQTREVVLFQSTLLASGPSYRRLHSSPLNRL